jgi:transcriptional regulator with XRE-family HTH domain
MGRGKTPGTFSKRMGELLTAARISAGYASQEEFAARLEVDRARYSKWESGRTPIPAQFIPQICKLTRHDANYFFDVRAVALPAVEYAARRDIA